MNARRLTSVALGLLCASAGVFALASPPALALNTHVFSSSFGGSGSGAGQLSSPGGVAVSSVTHDVYVADTGNLRVDEFSPSGIFLRAWGWGVADGLPAFETCTLSCQAGLSGSAAGQFTSPVFVAVDNSAGASAGDVYVGDTGDNLVSKFDSSGSLVAAWASGGQLDGSTTTTGSLAPLAGITVDGAGRLIVINERGESNKRVFEFAQDGTFGTEFEVARGTSPNGLAVDATGDIFKVNGEPNVEELTGSGSDVGQVTASSSAKGIAVDPLTGDLYADEGGHVDQYVFPGVGEVSEPGGSTCVVKPQSGCGPSDSFGTGSLSGGTGIGVDPVSGNVYVADASTGQVDVFVPAVFPDANTGQGSGVHPTAVTLKGAVSPGGVQVTGCQFEFGTSTSYGQSVPCEQSPASIGSGTSPVAVSANLSALQPNTEYHFRLLASNANGTSRGVDVVVTTTGPPRFDGEWVANVAATSATVDANINPRWPTNTEYRLEYGMSTSYGETVTGSVGGGSTEVVVSVHRQDLQSDTNYHYRIVVSNVYGTVEGPDQTFTTQITGGQELSLPDGRAWELVSPPDKKGALIEPTPASLPYTIRGAGDGSGITYPTSGPAVGEDPAGKRVWSQVLSVRGPKGWMSQDITIPHSLPEKGVSAYYTAELSTEYSFFSPDLSVAVVEPPSSGTPLLSPEATELTLYLRNDVNGTFTPLVTAANVPPGTKFGGQQRLLTVATEKPQENMNLRTVTPDLSHVVFASPFALTPGATRKSVIRGGIHGPVLVENLYEWGEGRLQLVNVLPDGKPAPGEGSPLRVNLAGQYEDQQRASGSSAQALSSDGRRIAWTVGFAYPRPGEVESEPYGGLYVRDMVEERTLRVGGQSAVFQTMSSDGSKIFFLEKGDLYEFDFDTDTQVDLTAARGAGESSAGVQESVVGVSKDGSSVYFVAEGVLAAGAVRGEDNLYLLRSGAGGWSTTFIGTLSGEDTKSWSVGPGFRSPVVARVSARVSSDGRYLTFMSNRSLTGYDNIDAYGGERDEELYLYDAATKKLVCVSCNPTGARPVGVLDTRAAQRTLLVDPTEIWDETETGPHWLAGSVPGWANGSDSVASQPRYLSDRGRLFFNSPDALVPQDTNGLEDVYEYEPAGVGGCTSASTTFSERSGGCVNLISSGTSSTESAFYDASESGDDVFFLTASRLTAADYDTSNDVYDAHVCSSSVPCATVPLSPPPCTSGDSCKAAPSSQPEIFGPAPSATFSGIGNVVGEPREGGQRKVKAKPKKHARQKHRRKGRKARLRVGGPSGKVVK
jgi:DNA-binding beta-propeller fold protein YncE